MGQKHFSPKKEHILACLSSAPSNVKIIRTAARMAEAFDSQFTALFVETPDFSAATPENKQRLLDNRNLAESLGANIEIVYGDDVPYQIAEYARILGITRIVLGQSAMSRKRWFGKPTLTEQLIAQAPTVDIHIIPDRSAELSYRPKKAKHFRIRSVLTNSAKSIAILLAVTLLSFLFDHLGFSKSTIIMLYLLGVLLTSISATHRIYGLLSSLTSVLVFNYLFTTPRFSLSAYESGYPFTFLVMFLTAYITATFAIRYKEHAGQSARVAHRTKILFDAGKLLSKAEGKQAIIQTAAAQIIKLLDRNLVVFDGEDGVLGAPQFFNAGKKPAAFDAETEMPVARWVMEHNRAAGATTHQFPNARYLYLAFRVNNRVYGVMGIEAENDPLDAVENSMLLSLLGEGALALENEKNAREKEAAAVLAEREQLRANLLRMISHDLRTPLTTISGNASNLMYNSESFNEETKQQIYADIYDDSMWLINLVENLLYATRIEDGRMTLNTAPELISEIMDEAVNHVNRKTNSHPIRVDCADELLLVRADAKLIVQVITNIVDNAIKYTPPGTSITIRADRNDRMAKVMICDTGNGIPDEEKERIFDKFYCCNNRIADNRRSLGLGLYLCKTIIEAHGGTIRAADNHPHGAAFIFDLPVEEVPAYE